MAPTSAARISSTSTLQTEKIRAVCDAVRRAGVPIVVNARTDSFWLKLGDEKERLRASIERANRYREAGADCLFVPGGDRSRRRSRRWSAEIDGPLNILTVPGCPPVAELEELGVRRVSEGSGPMRATMMLTRQIARELLRQRHLHALPRRRDCRIPKPTACSSSARSVMKFRAAVLNRVNAPLTIDTLDMAPLQPGDVLVRIRASGLCHTDLEVIQGCARVSAADRARPRRRRRRRGGRRGT